MRFISSLALVQLAAYANFAELLDTTRNNDIDQLVRLTVKIKNLKTLFNIEGLKNQSSNLSIVYYSKMNHDKLYLIQCKRIMIDINNNKFRRRKCPKVVL